MRVLKLAYILKLRNESKDPDAVNDSLTFSDGNSKYICYILQAVGKVNEVIHAADKPNGLASIDISPSSGKFATYSTITLGARGDSYYEYLLKQWIQGGKKEND